MTPYVKRIRPGQYYVFDEGGVPLLVNQFDFSLPGICDYAVARRIYIDYTKFKPWGPNIYWDSHNGTWGWTL